MRALRCAPARWPALTRVCSTMCVAGSSTRMPADVMQCVVEAFSRGAGVTEAEARKMVRRLQARGRYLVEAW